MRITPARWFSLSLVTMACGAGAVAAGCADPHPITEASESEVQEGTSATSSTALPERICAPGAARECKNFWYDRTGQVHCNLNVQICRADGYAWQTCGDLDAGPSPDAGSDVDVAADDAGAR